jgi:5-methylcytosine-specific restriction endonuclease McrA
LNPLAKLSAEQRAELVRLYLTPLADGSFPGTPYLAEHFGIRRNAVQNILRKEGVQLRSLTEAFANHKRTKPITSIPVGEAPRCQCGCGTLVHWIRRERRWAKFTAGHYHPQTAQGTQRSANYRPPVHLDRDWLVDHYLAQRQTLGEIGTLAGVTATTIHRRLDHYGIPKRTQSEARIGRQIGEKNPAWKGGVAKWNYSPGWKRISRQAKEAAGYCCQKCGKHFPRPSKALHVHHRNEDRADDRDENLIVICSPCHTHEHFPDAVPRKRRHVKTAH